MSFVQVKPFNRAQAGTTPNWCLANVIKGYGIAPKYPDAWTAWLKTQQHPGDAPTGLDVPVFFSYSATIDGEYKNWGHIGVRLANGQFWSDGNIYSSISAYEANHTPRYVGWGESINDTKVIQGEDNMIIPDQDNWYARFAKLMVQIRGRGLGRDEFRKNFVGNEVFHMVEILSDNPEADEATAPQAQDIKNFCSAVYKVQADAQDLSYAGKPWHDVMYYLAGKYQTKIEPVGTNTPITKDAVIKYIQAKLT